VQDDGTPCLTDFGLATVRYNGATLTSALDGGGSWWWMAQELFEPRSGLTSEDYASSLKTTRYSDIWSFAMLALELFTEEVPFVECVSPGAMVLALQRGERPKRPGPDPYSRGLGNELWKCLCECWDKTPENRPPLKSLHSVLKRLADQWSPALSVEQKRVHPKEVRISPVSRMMFY
jgi:Serine/threonine protein kinase